MIFLKLICQVYATICPVYVNLDVPVGSCTLQLINDGLTILENKVSIEFAGSPDVQSFTCRLDGMKTRERCRSPLRFENLSPGPHKLIILSNRCGEKRGRLSLTFDI